MKYILGVIGVLAVALGGSWLTQQGLGWYSQLQHPTFTPTGGVIGIVWTIIFILSAISLILWLQRSTREINYYRVIWWFAVSGVLNLYWTYLFFFKQQMLAAVFEMIGLELSVLILIWLMWNKVRWSALLLIPYAVWVGFATYLAYSVWLLNK